MTQQLSWRELYRQTIEELYEFVSRRSGGDRQLAEDLVQETYLRALAAWQQGERPQVPLAWLKQVGRNLMVSYFRRQRPESVDPKLVAELDASRDTDPKTAGQSAERVALLQFGLAQLKDVHSRLLESFYLDGKDTRTLALEFGCSERAVEGRLHRARHKLKRALSPLLKSVKD